jgi:CDGSH-type Zn-finger protein
MADEPISPQKSPYVIDEIASKKAWCACGRSEKQPFCDGSHSNTDLCPVVITLEEGKRVAWCGCKKTGNPPYCDGSHKNL